MKKEEIEGAARILSEIKDALNELDSALKSNNAGKVATIKKEIADLQSKIGEAL